MVGTPPPTATRRYASIRDQLASEITAGVYPAGALLPSIREIMQRWEVSTTTARRALDELTAGGFARKEGTRGHISTGGAPPAPPVGDYARKAPPPIAVPGRLSVRSVHTIPASGSITPDTDGGLAALDVRAERPPADAAVALGVADPTRPVIVRRRLLAAADETPVQFRVSYLPAELAERTPIAQPHAIPDAWPAALSTYLGRQVRLASSHVTARHPTQEEAAALALASDAAVLVREDIYQDRRGNPVDFTRTVWPGDATRLVVGG
ncbi:MAG: GntR family transcriptional regulator [Pseudonocardiales bacterium]|nr:GntR family transcriptional regulator [Pseudonocardiales bacterium]MBW0010042.1 GntR family transcriptional regulator [Pseudonocardiales bacterium]